MLYTYLDLSLKFFWVYIIVTMIYVLYCDHFKIKTVFMGGSCVSIGEGAQIFGVYSKIFNFGQR